MSFMLEFPPSRLPHNVRAPPYVLFGINGAEAFEELPSNIPLNLVLHFAPKLRSWMLPPPTGLPKSATYMALRTPYVGIDILADIEVQGLEWIINKMMQCAGLPLPPKSTCTIQSTLMTSIAVHKAWLALDLPVAGLTALHAHMQMRLMMGEPVTLLEIQGIWHTFPHDSSMIREMGLNFVRSHVDFRYTCVEFSAIRDWYLESRSRCKLLRSLKSEFSAFEEVQDNAIKVIDMPTGPSAHVISGATIKGLVVRSDKKLDILEKQRTKKVRPKEKKNRESQGRLEMKKRLDRIKSDDSLRSVETVIWNPPAAGCAESGELVTRLNGDPNLKAVDHSIVADFLHETGLEGNLVSTMSAQKREIRHRARQAPERISAAIGGEKAPAGTGEVQADKMANSRHRLSGSTQLLGYSGRVQRDDWKQALREAHPVSDLRKSNENVDRGEKGRFRQKKERGEGKRATGRIGCQEAHCVPAGGKVLREMAEGESS